MGLYGSFWRLPQDAWQNSRARTLNEGESTMIVHILLLEHAAPIGTVLLGAETLAAMALVVDASLCINVLQWSRAE